VSSNWIVANHTAREFFDPLDLGECNNTFVQPGPRTAAALVALLHERWKGAAVEAVSDCGGTNERAYDIEFGEITYNGRHEEKPYRKLTGPMLEDLAAHWGYSR
jgi:hypothetical protein